MSNNKNLFTHYGYKYFIFYVIESIKLNIK